MSLLTEDIGCGACGAGSSAAGFGETATMNSITAKLFIKLDGTQGYCALIDQNTGDFVLDSEGNRVGDDAVNQLVYLALFTEKGSSVIFDFGLELQQDTINDNTKLIVTNSVKLALKSLIDRQLVELIAVNVSIAEESVSVGIIWRDVTRNKINNLSVNG
jgi:hypothetical protein